MVSPVNRSNTQIPKNDIIKQVVHMAKIAGEAEVIGSDSLSEQTKISSHFKADRYVEVERIAKTDGKVQFISTSAQSAALKILFPEKLL